MCGLVRLAGGIELQWLAGMHGSAAPPNLWLPSLACAQAASIDDDGADYSRLKRCGAATLLLLYCFLALCCLRGRGAPQLPHLLLPPDRAFQIASTPPCKALCLLNTLLAMPAPLWKPSCSFKKAYKLLNNPRARRAINALKVLWIAQPLPPAPGVCCCCVPPLGLANCSGTDQAVGTFVDALAATCCRGR